jgi:ankyrin repeat protein
MDDILHKVSCIDEDNNCNIVKPYTELEFSLNNPFTNKKYTIDEKEEKIKQHTNLCKAKRGIISECCDPTINQLSKSKVSLPASFKETFKKIKIVEKKNNMKSIKVCQGSNCPGYREPTLYEYCKLKYATIDYNGEAENLMPDCNSANCNNMEIPFIISSSDKTKSNEHLEDLDMVTAVKSDDLENLQLLVNNNKKKANKVLSYGFPGNTLLHEALYRNSKNCFYYLLEHATNVSLEIKNQDGNSPLQIACLKGNKDMVNMILKFGGNIYTKNKYGDTPLHSAIRIGNEEIIRFLLFNGSSIFEKNTLGESPLFTSVNTLNKKLIVIKILCEAGSELLEKNNSDKTMLKVLSEDPEAPALNREIETYLIQQLFKMYETDQDSYKEILKTHPEFSPFEIVGESKDSDIDNLVIKYDETLDDTELYTEKIQLPKKVLPESAKKFMANNIIESFETQNKKTCSNINNIYLMGFLLVLLLLGLLFNNYFI